MNDERDGRLAVFFWRCPVLHALYPFAIRYSLYCSARTLAANVVLVCTGSTLELDCDTKVALLRHLHPLA